MRHATANPGGGRDHERSLTDHGKDEAHHVGRWLASAGRAPDRVLSSTALRCRETWFALSAGLGREVPVEFESRLYNATPEVLFDSLTDLTATVGDTGEMTEESVLLIAHNPGISYLALDLAGEDPAPTPLRSGFAPATTACFEITSSWAMLSPSSAHLTCYNAVIDL